MSNPDDPQQSLPDRDAPVPDPVTGSSEHATGTEQAAENQENDPPA